MWQRKPINERLCFFSVHIPLVLACLHLGLPALEERFGERAKLVEGFIRAVDGVGLGVDVLRDKMVTLEVVCHHGGHLPSREAIHRRPAPLSGQTCDKTLKNSPSNSASGCFEQPAEYKSKSGDRLQSSTRAQSVPW